MKRLAVAPLTTGEAGVHKGHGAAMIQQVAGERGRGTSQRNVSTLFAKEN